jgi:hypothetical protein
MSHLEYAGKPIQNPIAKVSTRKQQEFSSILYVADGNVDNRYIQPFMLSATPSVS